MKKLVLLFLPLSALGIAGAVMLGPATNRSTIPPTPAPPASVALLEASLPLPSPTADPLLAPPCAPEVVLPEVLSAVAPPAITTATLPLHPIFAPVYPASPPPALADPDCAPQTVVLLALTPATAEELANALDKKVKVDAYEAAEIRILNPAGDLLATRAHERTSQSPQAGDRKRLTLYSAYQANANGRICTNARGDPVPAANAVPIGTLEVSNACTNQNVRIALEGLQAFVAGIN